ncbi:PABP-interacting PAM2 motif-containing protein, partial [Escherichia coli]
AIDTAPDSWDQEDDGEAQVDVQLSKALTSLNVDAKPFVPNVHAAVFVPSFQQKGSAETVESAGPDTDANVEVAEPEAPPMENGDAEMATDDTW